MLHFKRDKGARFSFVVRGAIALKPLSTPPQPLVAQVQKQGAQVPPAAAPAQGHAAQATPAASMGCSRSVPRQHHEVAAWGADRNHLQGLSREGLKVDRAWHSGGGGEGGEDFQVVDSTLSGSHWKRMST
jgi:hypothetical protein